MRSISYGALAPSLNRAWRSSHSTASGNLAHCIFARRGMRRFAAIANLRWNVGRLYNLGGYGHAPNTQPHARNAPSLREKRARPRSTEAPVCGGREGPPPNSFRGAPPLRVPVGTAARIFVRLAWAR